MILLNLGFAGICFVGIITEFMLPAENQSQGRLFINAIFFGLNAYFAWLQF